MQEPRASGWSDGNWLSAVSKRQYWSQVWKIVKTPSSQSSRVWGNTKKSWFIFLRLSDNLFTDEHGLVILVRLSSVAVAVRNLRVWFWPIIPRPLIVILWDGERNVFVTIQFIQCLLMDTFCFEPDYQCKVILEGIFWEAVWYLIQLAPSFHK